MSHKRSRRDFEAEQKRQDAPYAVYGHPLPPLDDHARDDGTYVPLWKQEVTDERGRKRLHGAFTGGFSAGYFNTVGSKEGWTPSTFVSSRTNRAQNGKNPTQQRPEDFMDEEDIRELEESKQISVSSGQAGFGTVDDPSQQNRLLDIFRSKEDSHGIRLLKRMGWKEGVAIGRNSSSGADTSTEDPSNNHDIKVLHGSYGLGYAGGADSNVSRGHDSTTRNASAAFREDEDDNDSARPGLSFAGNFAQGQRRSRTGAAISSINSTGSDEEDVFSMGPKISYNKVIGSDKKSKKSKTPATINANPLVKTQPVLISKRLPMGLSSLRRCHDGRLPLEGFVLGDQLDTFSSISITDHDTRPPEVPSDWKSNKLADTAVPSDGVGNSGGPPSSVNPDQLSAAARSRALGEKTLPSKSVFDYLSPAARNQLSIATGRTDLPPARNEAAEISTTTVPKGKHRPADDNIPHLDPVTAKAALSKGFMPYSDNLAKQSRYKAFLEYSSDKDGNATPPSRAEARTKEEFVAELYEFTRAAQVFKPVSGLMASRFTTSTSSGPQENSGSDDSTSTATLLTKPTPKPTDPAEDAARMGMFGLATRTVANFYPTKLVCKRFGVDMPSM